MAILCTSQYVVLIIPIYWSHHWTWEIITIHLYIYLYILLIQPAIACRGTTYHPSVHLSIHPSVHLLIHSSIHPCIYSCMHPFIHPTNHISSLSRTDTPLSLTKLIYKSWFLSRKAKSLCCGLPNWLKQTDSTSVLCCISWPSFSSRPLTASKTCKAIVNMHNYNPIYPNLIHFKSSGVQNSRNILQSTCTVHV